VRYAIIRLKIQPIGFRRLAQTVQPLQNLFSQILSKLDLVWLVHAGIRIIQSAFIAIAVQYYSKNTSHFLR